MLRTKKQVVTHTYGDSRSKVNSVIKDGKEIFTSRTEGILGYLQTIDMHGNETVSQKSFKSALPVEVEMQRCYSYTLRDKLRKLIVNCCQYKSGCEIPYLRNIGGYLLKILK